MRLVQRLAFLLATGVCLASPVMAQDAAAPAAPATSGVDVTANEMEILDAEKKTIFRGEVVAIRDQTTINCTELVVNYVPVKQADGTEKDTVDVMKATGNVKIVTDRQTITSEWANIYDREDRLEAGGNVKLVQDANTLRGEKLTVNLKDKHTVMTGGRVKGSFLPN